ncbi:MAG: succinate dehydrogenase, cytochrome b556 subunit [Pseudomonadota bacterium]
MSDVNRPVSRPLSPHLQVYAWSPSMLVSTLHRMTGLAMTAGTLVLTWGLVALASGQNAWDIYSGFLGSIVGTIILIGFTWALFQHMMSGIRHLIMDTGAGLEIGVSRKLSILTFVGSFGLTGLVWAAVLLG